MDLLEVTLAFSPINRRRLFRFLFGMRMMVPRQHCRNVSRCSTFGGEGTGLHANYDFNWTAGVTYAGLVHSSPLGNGYTDISGYFKHENGEWYHLATYRRKTNSPYLTGLYSFVENWAGILVNETRRVNYGNQWVRNAEKRYKS
ncbi:hypothetical protein BGW37DRAFT_222832 [Umbelopsis sp. PMI_123]|nr:hypothetical protein BGW37DRAFT_222832 [Umbelopsis sp. PMI_123]